MTEFIHLRGGDMDGQVYENYGRTLSTSIEVDCPDRWQTYLPTDETYEVDGGTAFIYDFHPEIFSINDKQPDAFIGPLYLPPFREGQTERRYASELSYLDDDPTHRR